MELIIWVNDQLDAQLRYTTFIIIILYMFRATLCSSSGGEIVSTQHLLSASNRNEYHEYFLGLRWPARKADNFTTILCRCYEIWEP